METLPLSDDIKSAERYIVQKGIIFYIRLIQDDFKKFDTITTLQKHNLLRAKVEDLAQLYVINYQVKACYNLIKQHALFLGNYQHDLDDIKKRISEFRKAFKTDFQRELEECNGKGLINQFKDFYK